MFEIWFGSICIKWSLGEYWLEQRNGEGMTVSSEELERILQDYFGGNF